MSTIGIIGAGNIGRSIAKVLARHGLPATLANRRGPDSLAAIVAELGPSITAGTREEAAAKDIVFVAVNWSKLPAALGGLPDFGGRIVIDANNPIEAPRFEPIDLGGRTSTEVFSELVPGARVVKAFNHLSPELLGGDPVSVSGGRRVLFLTGEDAAARADVLALVERLGFSGIDLGSLASGARLTQFPGGPLPGRHLVQLDAEPAGDAVADFDAILRANLQRVFNERDAAKRLAALDELFVADPVMFEPGGTVNGKTAIADVAGKLLDQFGPAFEFVPDGRAVGHHGMASLRWTAGPRGGGVTVTGIDTAEIVGGRITRLWVLLDAPKDAG